ncbi:hypothetical protein PHYBLDRAFT_145075 [Phycomyces blakesleeanus NRRL 1555(-)]|uniref:Uncharacterized protein n=1 Tax=Phycomyces blakesleeanus (strain ATCC 8743b / DSM 1359 / FGSC 10004 / NBRC 33097 / NRRL 1555) TaxID=763407 RepID=A0A167MQU4_PHYB8|nr:hypothetical protein PHYBLDRAFT_145075 [Phycomyces blakesleeanus NRRL 1555(-)]OAD73599.1 hypothetical protein PHYBLDRAFT_145075 [Phycomyces blakesleeanus NRRL 1555(-)]|eukprot:XP_018291639.1 hypothetical protein PHYBLDRAFT_145075 [Phycomyces blakesleeanus NRRL 1555(-)]
MHRLWNQDLAAVLNFRHILNNLRYDGIIPVRFTRVIRIGRIRRQAEEDLQEGRRPTQATAEGTSQVFNGVQIKASIRAIAKSVFDITSPSTIKDTRKSVLQKFCPFWSISNDV